MRLGQGWCHRFGEQKLSDAVSVEHWCPPPSSSGSSSRTGAAWQLGFCLICFLFPFFLLEARTARAQRDSGGFAAIQRRRLVLCQLLCWGKAGGNPFCNVSTGAVGRRYVECSRLWPGLFLCLAALKASAWSDQSRDLTCPISAHSMLCCRFTFCSP